MMAAAAAAAAAAVADALAAEAEARCCATPRACTVAREAELMAPWSWQR